MRFRKQLYVGLGALIALITTTAATGIFALHVTNRGEDGLARAYADDLALAVRLQLLVERAVAASRGYLLTGDHALRAQFDDAKQQLEHLLAQQHGAELAEVGGAAWIYLRAATEAVDRGSTDRTLIADTATLDSEVSALARSRRARFEAALGHTREMAQHAQIALSLSSILAIACGLALAYVVSRRLSQQYCAANREAAARQEILAIVSHDLRNPLHAITMGASFVQDSARDEPTRGYARTIDRAADRMQHMIAELLETSRLESGQLELHCEPVPARDLIEAAVDMFRARAAERQIDLATEACGAIVRADAERVIEILSNLIGNALKFSGGQTRVVVGAQPRGARVRFAVADQGPGISAVQLPHVFDRYWQADRKRARDGLGLGLHICKWLVEAQGGTIGVDSEVGQGSTFWFELPG